MNIRLGIYEIFSRIVPGGVYLAALGQLLLVLGILPFDAQALSELPLTISFGLIVAAYILGGAFDNVALIMFRVFKRPGLSGRSFSRFKKRQEGRWRIDFRDQDWPVLFAYIRTKNMELAGEIERHNAISIMTRNIGAGLVMVAVNFLVELLLSGGLSSLLLCIAALILSALTFRESVKFRGWFYDTIFETTLAYRIDLESSITPVGKRTSRDVPPQNERKKG